MERLLYNGVDSEESGSGLAAREVRRREEREDG